MRADGIYIKLGPIDISWHLWETYCAYDAETPGGTVFIREQRRKFWPKNRRIVTYPVGHPERDNV